jgi:hypothetical protein
LIWVPGEGSNTGNETGGRKFARYHFVARQMRSPPFLAPDNRMRVGVIAQPSFRLYPCWRPAILAPVYGWFTEGFDTRDLKEDKALLEELAA